MNNRRNHYRILNVQPDAPMEVIRSSYRTMMQKMRMHPDLGGDESSAAVINEAYAVLINPGYRADYDNAQSRPERQTRPERHRVTQRKPLQRATPSPAPALRCPFCGAPHAQKNGAPTVAACGTCQSPLSHIKPSSLDNDGRRKILRLPKECPLHFFTHWPQDCACSGHSIDLSVKGMNFLSDTSLERGQVVKIDACIFSAVARVTHRQALDSGYSFGVEFISVIFEEPRGNFVSAWA